MLPRKILCFLLPTITLVAAAPVDDMGSVRASCESTANMLNASLNNTAAMNTSVLVQNIVWRVGASSANLGAQNYSSTTAQTTNNTSSLDSPYFDYIDSILTLSEALIRRGRVSHQESNSPVFSTLQSLASVVQTYGMQLSNAGLISRSATIRTLTAASSLVDAQSIWAANHGSDLYYGGN